jgi:triacylglycerol esterase/lipase EstA (alpha/beta hydrolase family)
MGMLNACSMLTLEDELAQAKSNQYLIKAQISSNILNSDSRSIVLLYKKHADGSTNFVAYRLVEPLQNAYFVVPHGDYELVAFEDKNQDYKYQEDERTAIQKNVPLNLFPEGDFADYDYATLMRAVPLELRSEKLATAYQIDLAMEETVASSTLPKRNYLEVITLDDIRFSDKNTLKGMWEPYSFSKEIGYGFYLLSEWDSNKTPLFLVHGINSSPSIWCEFIEDIDQDKYQIIFYHYPSAESLSMSAYYFGEVLIDIKQRNSEHNFTIVAHSMGGLVSRGAIQYLVYKHHPNVTDLFITLSTPWGGDEAARLAVETSPIVAPVWRDLSPDSQYLDRLQEQDLPQGINHILLSSYAGDNMIISEKNDGAVTLKSQLAYEAQDAADKVYLINATHVGILTDPQTREIIKKYLN